MEHVIRDLAPKKNASSNQGRTSDTKEEQATLS